MGGLKLVMFVKYCSMRVSDDAHVLDTSSLLDESCEMLLVDDVDLYGGLTSTSLVVLVARRVCQVPADRHDEDQRAYTHRRRAHDRPSRSAENVRQQERRRAGEHRDSGHTELDRRPGRLRRRQRCRRRAGLEGRLADGRARRRDAVAGTEDGRRRVAARLAASGGRGEGGRCEE